MFNRLKKLVLVTSFSLCFMLISAQIISFAEVRDLKDSAVAAWSFEGNLEDITDNGNDGKKLGKTTFVAGKFGKAIRLSGKGDGVITPKLAPMNEVTVAHWSKCTGRIGAWRVWINVDGWQKGAVHHQLYPGNEIGWSIHTNKPTDVQAKLLIDDKQKGKWHHIAVVYSAGQKNVKFYINGELNNEGKYTSVGPAILGPARIGSWDGGGRDYEGEIDEFAIFNTALSATDIKSIATKSLATVLSGDTSVDAVGKATAVWARIRAVY